MNIHHLELFYYVAKHGGISEAVRNIPYGIQQPAMSGQIIQLEESLGATLFQRRPFALTAQGKELMEFIASFFENIEPQSVNTRCVGFERYRVRVFLRHGAAKFDRTVGLNIGRHAAACHCGRRDRFELGFF